MMDERWKRIDAFDANIEAWTKGDPWPYKDDEYQQYIADKEDALRALRKEVELLRGVRDAAEKLEEIDPRPWEEVNPALDAYYKEFPND